MFISSPWKGEEASEASKVGVRGGDACASLPAADPHLTSPFQGEE
jgi:hypothetical protein